ncbi:MAG: hypothetical protein C0392_08445 [Syntrophus sp. (in: bacteria)]|nr:hypothetical protein [Syntrophus sp. (in: bacteria)]
MAERIMGGIMQKILAIDDKMDNLITLSALLKNLMPGCVVINAQSGLEGIAKAKAELPDAILLDVKMPEMDGFETCRRLMYDESTKQIPVIMITAIKTDAESRSEVLDCGANAFLSKPIDEVELVSQVKVALRIKKAEDALREERDSLEKMVQERTAHLLQEIAERKRGEAKLKESKALVEAVVENVPLMIFLKEAKDLRFVIFNRAGEELLGYDRRDLTGKNDLDLFPPEQAAHFMAHDLEALDGETDVLDIPEEPILTAKKGERFLHTRKVCIRGSDGTTKYLLGISEDITERKQAEEHLKETLEKLRKSLIGTIQALSSTVETRDPYTAGHQRRVSNLARTIAQEMGLSSDTVDAIRMAGIIHDIGKISVPAEILSKPGKITDIEMSLIKVHSQSGYNILKDVGLPYPIAEIVLQHHERLDGSGYPQGLKGDQILIEAQIISVADVVEAISSHRPYRPGFGMDTALEEIEKNKGILYNEKVVEACVKLFREKGFAFK